MSQTSHSNDSVCISKTDEFFPQIDDHSLGNQTVGNRRISFWFSNGNAPRVVRFHAPALRLAVLATAAFSLAPDFTAQAGDSASPLNVPGTIVGWGNNDHGQTTLPSSLESLGLCSQIAAGNSHTVALRINGTVKAWGMNDQDQCAIPLNLGACLQVAAGGAHTVALKQNGLVAAWGANTEGQANVPAGLGQCSQISAGGMHTLAIKQNGLIAAWGSNNEGQSTLPAGLGVCKQIIAGPTYSGAIQSSGTVVLWGLWQVEPEIISCTVPSNLGACTMIAAGAMHTAAINTAGIVKAWGSNEEHQCDVPSTLGICTQVAAGISFTVALKADGNVVAWGNNSAGQCSVPTSESSHGEITQVAAGSEHTVALHSNGNVTSWGVDSSGECGSLADGDIKTKDASGFYWTKSQSDSPCIALAVGEVHNVALKIDGSLVAWGDNSHGQCEIPSGWPLGFVITPIDGGDPLPIPSAALISAGKSHSVALSTLGIMKAWGLNNFGQCDLDQTRCTQIAAGGFHTAAIQMKNAFRFSLSSDQVDDYNLTEVDTAFSNSAEIDSRIANLDATVAKPYRTDGSNPTYLASSWLSGIKLTGIPLSKSAVNGTPAGSASHGALITPRHMIITKHYPYWSGSTTGSVIKFLNSNNEVKTGIVDRLYPIGGWSSGPDLLVVRFQSDVDSSITPMTIGVFSNDQDSFGNELPPNTPVIMIDQEEKALILEAKAIRPGVSLMPPSDPQRRAFHESAISFDSSSPFILLYENDAIIQPLLIGLTQSPGQGGNFASGPIIGANISLITNVIQEVFGDTDAKYKLNIFHNNTPNHGGIKAWGNNQYGQCSAPTNLTDCTQIVAGEYHTLALQNGAVSAWGRNDFGQCSVPTVLKSPNACTQIAAGAFHSVALRSNGHVLAWGRNTFGECNLPEDLGLCSQITAGGDETSGHTAAVRRDGVVIAWGENGSGQCDVPPNLGVIHYVGAGARHTLAVVSPENHCPADFDGSGTVDSGDLSIILLSYGESGSVADLDHSGFVDAADIGALLISWGECQ